MLNDPNSIISSVEYAKSRSGKNAARTQAQQSPAGLAEIVTSGRFKRYPHIELFNHHLMRASQGEARRLMIFVPPQHGKSTLCSQYFPAWYVGMNPHKRMILASYEAGFAAQWGGRTRQVLEEYGQDFFGVKVSQRSHARDAWDLDVSDPPGGMSTAGIGGPITGKTAHLLLIDDPIKNAVEAMSDATRQRNYDWFFSAALTRVSDDGVIVIIQTRWAMEDLSGQLIRDMETKGERWEIVSLPAIAEQDETWPTGHRRLKGEPLSPKQFSLETLETRRRAMSEYLWSALYQQRPIPIGGAIFKATYFEPRWKLSDKQPGYYAIQNGMYNFDPSKTLRFLTVDTALTEEEIGEKKAEDPDYTAIGAWLAFPTPAKAMLLCLDIARARISAPEIIREMDRISKKWGAAFIAIESKAGGQATYQMAREAGLNVKEIKPLAKKAKERDDYYFLEMEGDKTARAMIAGQPLMEKGRFFLPEVAPWIPEYLNEMLSFPLGAHDDQVDMTVYACAIADKYVPATGQVSIEAKQGYSMDRGERDPERDAYQPDPIRAGMPAPPQNLFWNRR